MTSGLPASRADWPRTGYRPSWFRLAVAVLLFALTAGVGGVSFAQSSRLIETRLAALAATPFKWDRHQALRLSGTPVYIKSFSYGGPAAQAAQLLAAHSGIFQRVLAVRNKIVLSGLQSGWHWLAQVEATAQGSTGYVSALSVDAHTPAAAAAEFEWLPPGAQKQFGQDTLEKSHTVAQHIYSVAMAPRELFVYLDRKLRRAGWTLEPGVADSQGASAWRRGQARLMLFPHASAMGSSLFVHYVE